MTARHRRQRPRPDGAALMRYVLCFCVKPLLEAGRDGGGGVRTGASAILSLRWLAGGGSHRSGRKITEEPCMWGSRCGARGASVRKTPLLQRPRSRAYAMRHSTAMQTSGAYDKDRAERTWASAVQVAGAYAARFE